MKNLLWRYVPDTEKEKMRIQSILLFSVTLSLKMCWDTINKISWMEMIYMVNMTMCGSISTRQNVIMEDFLNSAHKITKFVL